MFEGLSTLELFEQCVRRGLCENHIKQVKQIELAVQLDELPRKTFLFIRVNILYTLLFKKSPKCERIKLLLQRTPIFSRILAKGDASDTAEAILILDSVVVFLLCHLSKICCVGALFQKNNITSEDPDIKLIQQLLYVDRLESNLLNHLYPLLQKKFSGFDNELIKVSYILTVIFVRSYCVKLNIKDAVEIIEKECKGDPQWGNLKSMGDDFFQKGNYKDACNTYTAAVMLNSYSSSLFTQRAHTYLKLGKFEAAHLDAYVAVAIDPKWCEGYYVFSSSLFHQQMYQEAFNVAKYGLAVCESNGSFYNTLQTFHIEIEKKYLNKKSLHNISENLVNQDSANKPLPEKKYFPVLVDSDSADSESEACQNTVPELVDSSDSDESEAMEKKIKCTQIKNKTKKKRICPEDSSYGAVTEMDMVKIRTYLKEASHAILSDCGYKAVQIFRGPLRDFIDSSKLNTFEECEVVCIKYAYGIAYCKSGGYDDLLKCITVLKEVIEKHDSVTFPAAYYALGLTYRKLNRFKEALSYLEIVQNFLSKGIHFKVYTWPEVLTVIKETKLDILKVLVTDLIKECENPPNADALCRFNDCSYQPTIYYSDPDFKGYISLSCSEQCCLQYHLQCWKIIKAEKKLTDKEFLDEACFTPDCDGVFIKVQNIDKKGDLTKEFTSDFKKTVKQKWAKWEKKTDVKEKKKKKTNFRSDDVSLEVPNENGKSSSRKNSDTNDNFIPVQVSGTVTPAVKDDTSSENVLRSSQKAKSSELDDFSSNNDIYSSSVNSVQETKDIINISQKNESSNFQETGFCHDFEKGKEISNLKTDIPHSEKDNSGISIQEITGTSHFQNEINLSTEGMEENSSEFLVSQCIKNNVYFYMCDFLQHHGPLKADDPLLLNEMSSFPDEVNTMISQYGGIGEFLKNDLRFAFVGDTYVCVISDLAKAYRMNSNSVRSDLANFPPLESTGNSKFFNKCNKNTESHNFDLNPDAVEYTPVVSSLNGQISDHKTCEKFAENLNYSSSGFKTESSELSSNNANSISDSIEDKSKNCDTDIVVKPNSLDFIYEQTNVNGYEKCNEEISDKPTSQSIPNTETSNLDFDVNSMNYNRCFIENNENMCVGSGDFSPSNSKKETVDCCNPSYKDSELEKFLNLLPVLKEFCDKDFNSYQKFIDACIKPYGIRKLTKTVATGTETDFENITTEQVKGITNSLKAENNQLKEENLSLKNQLTSATMEIKKLSGEVSELKNNLNSSSFDLEVLKIEYKKKEEAIQNGREYLIKSLTSAHSSIDEQKKRIELLESINSRLEETVDKLTPSLKEEEKMKNAVKAEEKRHEDIIKNLQRENDELKSRLKCVEIQFLQTKKAEFLKRIEDKFLDVTMKKQELTRGLSMISGNLNPVVQSSMKTIFSQFSSYEDELKTLKLEFVKNIDAQIEKVKKGTPLKELKDIEIKKIPDPPHMQGLFPETDKSLLNPTQMDFNLLNMSSFPHMPSASVLKAIASTTNIPPPSTVIPPTNPLATVNKPLSLSSIIPTAAAAAIIPQVAPSAAIFPQATPSATFLPQATPSAKVISSAAPASQITHSVLASLIPDIGTNQKKSYDSLNTKIQEPLSNSGISLNSFSSIPYTVPTLDKEFNKTCAIFRPPDSIPNNKPDTSKMPPGIVKSATNLFSSSTASNSSKDSLESFSVEEKAIGSINLASKVNESVLSTSEQEKKKVLTGTKVGSSYDKLLQKLKEQFPSYSQEELISLVKEFRSKRQGKLTGLPIDAIISELKTIVNSRKEAEKKINEQKMQQAKVNKVLVNKKLVDSKAPAITEQQQCTKKKSAWGTIDSDSKKTFSGNPYDDCVICCDPMTASTVYNGACGHNFHEDCIRQWLKKKSNCPVCRVLLLLPEEYPSLS